MSKSLQKFCRILQCFTPSEPSWTATSLAAKLEMPVSTVHGLLVDLAKEAFLSISLPAKEYRIGFKYLEMGFMHANNFELNNIAHGIMRELVFKTGYLSGLSVLYKGWMYVTMSVLPLQNTSDLKYVGPRLPAHITSGGLAILSHLPQEKLDAYCSMEWDANCLVPPILFADLSKATKDVRSRGYSLGRTFSSSNAGETIGAPIFGRNGQVIAALVLICPDGGFSEEQLADLSGQLLPAAHEITMRSGHISQSNGYI